MKYTKEMSEKRKKGKMENINSSANDRREENIASWNGFCVACAR